MCKGCSMQIGTETYLTEILPLGKAISEAFDKYERVIHNIPEMNAHHKAVVKLRRKFNEELNSYEPHKRWTIKTYTNTGIPNTVSIGANND